MAGREGDTALWLHNKLGSTDDLWSGGSICSQLTQDKLVNIYKCFHTLQSYVKVKLMLSFLQLPKRNIEEWQHELDYILQLAREDPDQWVAMIGDILKTYPSTGNLNCDIDAQNRFFHDVITDLKKVVKKSSDTSMIPLECQYLSKTSLIATAGHVAQPVKHFTLKRKPKSAALRADLLQKSSDAANNLKRGTSIGSVPIKSRSFAKDMNNKTPMRGIQNKVPASGGFLGRGSFASRSFHGSSPMAARTPNRKEGGIKLLDIKEMPLGTKEARRKRKKEETEAAAAQVKKDKEMQQSETPDYAAGLVNSNIGDLVGTGAPSYAPDGSTSQLPGIGGGTASLSTNSISAAHQQARENLQQQLLQQPAANRGLTQQVIYTPSIPPATSTTTSEETPAPAKSTPPADNTTQANNTQQPPAQKQGLILTREQMVEAQAMFSTSNKLSRREKALILGFMAGARVNPCPQQGNIVNIRLSEQTETVQTPDGLFRPMIIDTFFQMNFTSGEWKRIKKFREIEEI